MKLHAVALGFTISIPLANAYTGDLTYYTPGAGSCGITNKNGDAIVALSIDIMQLDDGSNPNDNPICNKQISIHNHSTGTDTIATVTDSCQACAFGSIDVPPDLFSAIAPNGNGRVHGIEWTPIGWTVPGGSGESDSSAAPSSASPVVQPSSSAPAAAIPSAALPSINVQEKVAAVVPSAAAAPSESPSSLSLAVSPSVAPALPSAASSSATQQPSAAPTNSAASCTTAGESVCSADGTQIGTCTIELTVEFGLVAAGTKCVDGYMVMANSRLRSRRG